METRYSHSGIMLGKPYRCKMLRAYGQIYAGQGREEESLAKFKEALQLENSR